MFQYLSKSYLKTTKLALKNIFKPFQTNSYGNLKDQDRIFSNLYNDNDPYINGALKRVLNTIFKFSF